MKDPKDGGREVQDDPYNYLLTERYKQSARNVPFRLLYNLSGIDAMSIYYLIPHNEMHRILSFSISLDLIFGLAWRCAIAFFVADQASKLMFVNYEKLRELRMAENEVRELR